VEELMVVTHTMMGNELHNGEVQSLKNLVEEVAKFLPRKI
jgi:hypothetical protein